MLRASDGPQRFLANTNSFGTLNPRTITSIARTTTPKDNYKIVALNYVVNVEYHLLMFKEKFIYYLFFRNRFKSILLMYLYTEGYALGRKPPNMEQAKIGPPRPLPSIGLSHLPVRKKNELLSCFSIDLYGRYRTKPREASEIRRVTDAWNTPARLYPFLLFDMCTRRCETNLRYTNHENTVTSGFRFNTEVYVDLDQGCDRRVESDFNTDSY